ncbi:MAG: radical SAM protein [Candidatus Bathyarchaeota archaeon]|nr:radical SAM protein [Candidatus Bathyarchaeota archaeon]
MLLNLPSPAGIHVLRDFGGGFGTASTVKKGSRQTVFPPLHEAFAAAILEKKGYDVAVVDGQIHDLSLSTLFSAVKKFNPDVIVCRVSAPSFDSDLTVISRLKAELPEARLVGWGSLCKMTPQDVMRKSKLDLVVGEAELEFAVSEAVQQAQKIPAGERVEQSEGRYVDFLSLPLNRDLDSLPPPAYHLLDLSRYTVKKSSFIAGESSSRFVRFASVLGSHGCSFNCIYCVYPVVFGKWRGRSPTKIVDDVEGLVKKYGVEVVWFEDQAFSMDTNRALSICNQIIQRGVRVSWACETRADKLSVELLKKMKKAGCTRIQLGIETGDPELFQKLGKSACNMETVTKNIKAIQNEGILVETNFIVGLPGETWDTVRNTAAFIDRVKPDVFSVSLATPYPGTQLYELAERNGWIVTRDWNQYGLSKPVLNMPTFTSGDMEKAREYLVSEASFKRQWSQMTSDLQQGHLGKVAKDFISNAPQIPRYIHNRLKGKLKAH